MKTTPLSLDIRGTESEKLFEDHHIYNHLRTEARHEIMLED